MENESRINKEYDDLSQEIDDLENKLKLKSVINQERRDVKD